MERVVTLPNFIVIGAFKSGTTSFYHYLNEHPDVYMSPVKETNFFAHEDTIQAMTIWETPIENRAFPVRVRREYNALFDGVAGEKAIGEVSPIYMISAVAPERILEEIPLVRLIAILRNPSDRAYSAYLMHARAGRENRPLEQVFAEPLRERVVHSGFYFQQLNRYFDLFPSDHIKIILYDDFIADQLSVLQDTYRFIGVDETYIPALDVKYNVGGVLKSRVFRSLTRILRALPFIRSSSNITSGLPQPILRLRTKMRSWMLKRAPGLPRDIHMRLIDVYREDIVDLQKLIKRDLTHWLHP
jgi:hypothetical protein